MEEIARLLKAIGYKIFWIFVLLLAVNLYFYEKIDQYIPQSSAAFFVAFLCLALLGIAIAIGSDAYLCESKKPS